MTKVKPKSNQETPPQEQGHDAPQPWECWNFREWGEPCQEEGGGSDGLLMEQLLEARKAELWANKEGTLGSLRRKDRSAEGKAAEPSSADEERDGGASCQGFEDLERIGGGLSLDASGLCLMQRKEFWAGRSGDTDSAPSSATSLLGCYASFFPSLGISFLICKMVGCGSARPGRTSHLWHSEHL